jgi:hypothetical protein
MPPAGVHHLVGSQLLPPAVLKLPLDVALLLAPPLTTLAFCPSPAVGSLVVGPAERVVEAAKPALSSGTARSVLKPRRHAPCTLLVSDGFER